MCSNENLQYILQLHNQWEAQHIIYDTVIWRVSGSLTEMCMVTSFQGQQQAVTEIRCFWISPWSVWRTCTLQIKLSAKMRIKYSSLPKTNWYKAHWHYLSRVSFRWLSWNIAFTLFYPQIYDFLLHSSFPSLRGDTYFSFLHCPALWISNTFVTSLGQKVCVIHRMKSTLWY